MAAFTASSPSEFFGAILVAGEGEAAVKFETVDDPIAAKCRFQHSRDGAGLVDYPPAVVAVGPAPQVRLG